MKPFDLEAAKRGEPIRTRDGRAAKFIAHVPEAYDSKKVVALITGNIYCFHESGKLYPVYTEDLDLFMAPRKRTVWVNLYRPRDYDYLCQNMPASAYYTEKEADGAISGYARIGNRAWPLEIDE